MNHYYDNNTELDHHYETVTFTLRDENMVFTTDSGVFSKHTIDYGSRVLIEAFDDMNLPEGALLDVGCGYGPIGLSLAKSCKRHVMMVDVNDRALELAKQNAEKNGVTDVVKVQHSDGYTEVTDSFAAIVTNPPIRAGKETVHRILEEAYDHLLPNGELWAVLQKKQGAKSAQTKMMEVFGNADIVKKDKGYYILRSRKGECYEGNH